MSENPEQKDKSLQRLLNIGWGGLSVYMSAVTFTSVPAFAAAGFFGVAGATIVGFATVACVGFAADWGGELVRRAGRVLQKRFQPKGNKINRAMLIPSCASSVLSAVAAYELVHEPLKDEVLRRLPSPTETQTPESGRDRHLLNLSGPANQSFANAQQGFADDQVLMQSKTKALVLPAGYRPRAVV